MHRSRRGISLMEVLISTFVLSIGLLGLAALIPVGRFAIVQTAKSDRAGACGRAGLRDVKVRRMLDYNARMPPINNPAANTDGSPYVIDPLGVANGLTGPLGGIPRTYLTWTPNLDAAEKYFTWPDDKVFNIPDDAAVRTEAQYIQADGTMNRNITDKPAINGHYSWFCTVAPAMAEWNLPWSEKSLFTVSVVVCYRRNYNMSPPAGERKAEDSATATFIGTMPVYPGGGSLMLSKPVMVKENDWILLYAPASGTAPLQCNWYRVVGVGEDVGAATATTTYVTVAGPDWYGSTATAVIVDSVIGVYTETVEMDTGLWNR